MWLEKYKPKTLNEFIGNNKAIYDLKKTHKKNENNLFIITGQTGYGKTLLSELFLKDNGYEINVLSNCQEPKNSCLKEKLENMLTFKNIIELMSTKKFAIILKDVDTMINDVLKIIANSTIKRTVFIILNNYKNLKKLKKYNIIELKQPDLPSIEKYLFDIFIENKYLVCNEGLKLLYNSSNGDIRHIILFLEELYFYVIRKKNELGLPKDKFYTVNENEINTFIEIKKKDISYDIYTCIKHLLFKKNDINTNLQYSYVDTYFIPTIIYDNLEDIIIKNKINSNDYLKCLEYFCVSEYINIKMFECQTNLSKDICLILKNHCSNNILNKKQIIPTKIKYSILMNKILKVNNNIKIYNSINHKTYKININQIILLLNYIKYYDEKKNTELITSYFEYFNFDNLHKKYITNLIS